MNNYLLAGAALLALWILQWAVEALCSSWAFWPVMGLAAFLGWRAGERVGLWAYLFD